jgi:CBS domain-containing protein
MDVELTEVRAFLARHEPFSSLPAEVLDGLPSQLTMRYYRRGSVLCALGEQTQHLFILRSGAVELHDDQGVLYERCGEGTSMALTSLIERRPAIYSFTASEDSLVLLMPAELFHALCEREPVFQQYYLRRKNRVRAAVEAMHASSHGGAILKTRVGDIAGPAVSAGPLDSVREGVRAMAESTTSGLLIVESGELVGIFTDHDLRVHVIAAGHPLSLPLARFMTESPVTVDTDAFAFEAVLEMVRRNIDHLPVTDRGRPVGMVTSRDLMKLEHTNPIYLAGDIAKKRDVAALVEASRRRGQVMRQLVAQDATADEIGRVVTAIGDQVTRRLLQLSEAELGPPPVPYCWVALGSQGRWEQGLSSDQDNALVLDDSVRPEHEAYFRALATRVCDGLAAAGYPYCPGQVMATNERWRQPLRQWRRQFRQWIFEPEPDALLHAAIFFDLRPIHGTEHLGAVLQQLIAADAPGNGRFLSHLAAQTVASQPPLGFFRSFVVEQKGAHAKTFDIKATGIAPIVKLARVVALSAGLSLVNTRQRLLAAGEAGTLSEESAADLCDSLEFISYVRLHHQAHQLAAGEEPDNRIPPQQVSSFDRRHLREAFLIVRKQQAVLAHRHHTNLLH